MRVCPRCLCGTFSLTAPNSGSDRSTRFLRSAVGGRWTCRRLQCRQTRADERCSGDLKTYVPACNPAMRGGQGPTCVVCECEPRCPAIHRRDVTRLTSFVVVCRLFVAASLSWAGACGKRLLCQLGQPLCPLSAGNLTDRSGVPECRAGPEPTGS